MAIWVKATVAAASAAVPPRLSASIPACTAIGDAIAETTPFLPAIERAVVGAQPSDSRFSACSRSLAGHVDGEVSAA